MALVVNGRGIWGVRPTPSDAWTRPADWLAMPVIGTQGFIGLLAVTDDDSNHIALNCAGAYTVDWGDGVIENVATGVKAQHTYTYSAISDSTLSTRGYKQVLVRVTPQAGQNLTTVNLQQQNSILKTHTVGWLDIAINGANITTLYLGGSTVYMAMCERINIVNTGNVTDFRFFFQNCYKLQNINLFKTPVSTSLSASMFLDCRSLTTIPLLDFSGFGDFTNFFKNCSRLKSLPLINTSSGTIFSGMFSGCGLRTIPLINTSNGTNFSGMFASCGVDTIPLLDTSKGTNFSTMFASCVLLKTIPPLNTIKGTNFNSMFSQCITLTSIPLLNTSAGKDFGNMFDTCRCLLTIPLLNTANATTVGGMFSSCNVLQYIPLIDTSKSTTHGYMFQNCFSLQQVPNLNTSLSVSFTNTFANVTSLAKGAFQGTRYAIYYGGMCLSQNAIVDIFNGLGTAAGAQTITVSSNPGYIALTAGERLIATSKGWTIA